jgi:hypothetical protein
MLTAREIGPKDRPIKMMMDTIVFDHKSSIITSFDGDGSIRSSAECLKVGIGFEGCPATTTTTTISTTRRTITTTTSKP